MTLRRISILATICLFVLGLMISPVQAFKGSYKVGALFSVTGRTSFLGDPEKKTAVMLADQINAAGGINGKKLELIVYDTEGDATKANLALKKLITKDKVCAVIGPSLSGTSLAVLPEAEKHKVPLVSCAASYKIVHNAKTGKPYNGSSKHPRRTPWQWRQFIAIFSGKV